MCKDVKIEIAPKAYLVSVFRNIGTLESVSLGFSSIFTPFFYYPLLREVIQNSTCVFCLLTSGL